MKHKLTLLGILIASGIACIPVMASELPETAPAVSEPEAPQEAPQEAPEEIPEEAPQESAGEPVQEEVPGTTVAVPEEPTVEEPAGSTPESTEEIQTPEPGTEPETEPETETVTEEPLIDKETADLLKQYLTDSVSGNSAEPESTDETVTINPDEEEFRKNVLENISVISDSINSQNDILLALSAVLIIAAGFIAGLLVFRRYH